jgi:hypothetical protein
MKIWRWIGRKEGRKEGKRKGRKTKKNEKETGRRKQTAMRKVSSKSAVF